MRAITFSSLALCLLLQNALCSQPLFINEFLAANAGGLADELGQNDDWAELYNPGPAPVDIGGMFVTDDLNEPAQWQIPATDPAATTIPAGGFLLLWFDKETAQGPLHVNAKLGADGEDIGLFAPDGTTQIDALTFGPQSANISFGRVMDGGPDFQFFAQPTPLATNSGAAGSLFAQAPTASAAGRFFQSPFQVELASATPNAAIRFTLDGSEPGPGSLLYSGPLDVAATTTLRARTFAAGLLPSPVATHSYLFGPGHSFPVVALSFNDADFFGPATGIYPNWAEEWARPVHAEFFEEGGQVAFSQTATAGIHGTGSASLPQKSLKIKAVANAGSGFFDHEIFPALPFGKYKSCLLRNAGQDFNITQFRDAFVASLAADLSDLGPIIEPPRLYQQAFRPGVVYLNGEYWGIQNLREHLNEDYLEQHFGLRENDLDFLDNDEAKAGDLDQWNSLMTYLQNNRFFAEGEMENLGLLVDLPHWLDYNVFNIVTDNSDWPGNNYRRWKERNANSQWRFLTFDLDFSFGLFTHVPGQPALWNSGDASANSLARALDSLATEWPNPWWRTLPFRRTMDNTQFRTDFANRTADFLNVLFDPGRVKQRINEFEAMYQPEIGRHFERWLMSPDVWPDNVQLLRKFADERPAHVRQHLVAGMPELTGTATVTLQAEPPEGGSIGFSTLLLPQAMLPWSGVYFTGVDIPVRAVAAAGFEFVGWSGASLGVLPSANLNLGGDLTLTAIFQPSTGDQLSQNIDFQDIPDQWTTAAPFQITATATSGLPVELEVLSGPATLSGSTLTLTGQEGLVALRATQPGGAGWQAAPPVLRDFAVRHLENVGGALHLLISPNPADDGLALQFYLRENGPVVFTIVSALGVEVFREKMDLQAGGHQLEVDIAPLASGAYVLQMDAEGMRRQAMPFLKVEE